MHDIELDAFHVMEFAVEGYTLHIEQPLHDFDGLAHRFQWLSALNTHLSGQGIPPGANATDDAIGRKIVERQEGCGE